MARTIHTFHTFLQKTVILNYQKLPAIVNSNLNSLRNKIIQKFQTFKHEFICSELTIAQKNWLCFNIHWTSTLKNLAFFFEKLTDSLRKKSQSYKDFIILSDFNRDVKLSGTELHKLEEFCDLFTLTNLIRAATCFTRDHKLSIDLILINKSKSFQNICVTETGVSGFHKLALILFKTQITCLKPKIFFYHIYKQFGESRFLEDLTSTEF